MCAHSTLKNKYVDTTESLVRMLVLILTYFAIFSWEIPYTIYNVMHGITYYPAVIGNQIVEIHLIPLTPEEWFLWFFQNIFLWLLMLCCFFISPWIIQRKLKLVAYTRLQKVTDFLSEKMDIDKPPKVFLTPSQKPYSFIFGRWSKESKLVLSEGLVNILNEEEIESVILHELSHIKNRDLTFMTWGSTFLKALKYYFALSICVIVTFYVRDMLYTKASPNSITELLTFLTFRSIFMVIVLLVTMLVINSVSRTRELLADTLACLYTDSRIVKAALIKISKNFIFENSEQFPIPRHLTIWNPLPKRVLPNFIQNFLATHPSLTERIDAIDSKRYLLTLEKTRRIDRRTIYIGAITLATMIIGSFVFQMVSTFGELFGAFEEEANLFFFSFILPTVVCVLLHITPFVNLVEKDPGIAKSIGLKEITVTFGTLTLKVILSMIMLFSIFYITGLTVFYAYLFLFAITLSINSFIFLCVLLRLLVLRYFPSLRKF